jgi:hypothetical protein
MDKPNQITERRVYSAGHGVLPCLSMTYELAVLWHLSLIKTQSKWKVIKCKGNLKLKCQSKFSRAKCKDQKPYLSKYTYAFWGIIKTNYFTQIWGFVLFCFSYAQA